ncbi:type VI secretion system-associated protein TagO [Phreatobacter stygius]|uniref:Type VI secretion system-associated protein TagO n=1 Tax=Phreatobacter stygius TaxID=1940610 RepID=A0A4D7BFT6_9HYPH|nr:type VI secretion system-associated protein TagO [Phreatobacter stygius]QCI66717.1 hypothetical protein E8M01_22240 [Phreatobacter stygius]
MDVSCVFVSILVKARQMSRIRARVRHAQPLIEPEHCCTILRLTCRRCASKVWPMNILRHITIQCAALALLAGPALPQGDALANVKRCASILQDVERLRCFDAAARSLEATGTSPGTGSGTSNSGASSSGTWDVQAGRPQPDGTIPVMAIQRPTGQSGDESIVLRVGCADGRTVLSVSRDPVIARSASTLVTLHVNDRLVLSDLWVSSTNYQSAAMPGDVADFLRSLPDAGRLSVRLEGSRGFRFEGTFELQGIDLVRRRVAQACRW